MIPASWAAAGHLGGLLIAQELVRDVGGLAGEAVAPATILGAMVVAERYLSKARKEALAMSINTAERAIERAADAEARLETEQSRWDIREATLLAEIERLRAITYPPPPKDTP